MLGGEVLALVVDSEESPALLKTLRDIVWGSDIATKEARHVETLETSLAKA